jgi:coproporphyrinogen III oxidase-like Fe-S oxidoreductase
MILRIIAIVKPRTSKSAHLTLSPPHARGQARERIVVRYARRRCRRSFQGFSPPRSMPRPPGEDILLYLHVPFCEEPCLYCSFHRIRFQEDAASAYFAALRQEMRAYAERGFRFSSVAAGGGTPTVLPDELSATLRLARSLWPIKSLTVETNPSHLTPHTLGLLRDAGVDRLSVGVQSLDDETLAALGRQRYGTSSELRETLARVAFLFPTLNVDLMFGFPGQTAAMAARDASAVRDLGVPQVTFYPLMYSSRTREAMARRLGYRIAAPLSELYDAIVDALGASYRPSSAWCFSRTLGHATDEYIVEHDQYAGLGAGAFGLIGRTLWATSFSVPGYVEAIRSGHPPFVLARRFSRYELWEHRMLMSLFSGTLRPASPGESGGLRATLTRPIALAMMRAWGAARREPGTLRATHSGRYLAVLAMREFFQAVNDFRDACRDVSEEDGNP